MVKNRKIFKSSFWMNGLLLGLSLGCIALALSFGSVSIPFEEIFEVFEGFLFSSSQTAINKQTTILLGVRLPRVLVAFLAGIAYSLSGMTMQSLLQNPLADGTTLGVTAGASLGAGIAIVIGIPTFFQGQGIFMMAILFAFITLIMILLFSYYLDRQLHHLTVILTGIIFSMVVSALMNILMIISREKLPSLVFWTMGSLSGTRYKDVIILCLAVIIAGGYIAFKWQELNALSMGQQVARNVGLDLLALRIKLLIASSVLIGMAVAIGGSIPFVGLITPHISRLLVGPNHQRLIKVTIFIGANFLVLTDLMARTLLSPLEIPIGAITSLLGSFLFIFILSRGKLGARR